MRLLHSPRRSVLALSSELLGRLSERVFLILFQVVLAGIAILLIYQGFA